MILDAATGGIMMNLTPRQVRKLIRENAESARFREETTQRDATGRTRNVSQVESNNNQLENELKEPILLDKSVELKFVSCVIMLATRQTSVQHFRMTT